MAMGTLNKFGKIVLPTEEEMEKMHENEYAYLQRQYQMMEHDAVAFSKESRSMIRKQQELIDTLLHEKEDVMVQVTVAKNPANALKDDRIISELSASLEKSDTIDEAIKKKKAYLREVELQVYREDKRAQVLRLKDVTDYQIHQQIIKSARTIGVLENRLYVANVKFNKVIAENNWLSEEIRHYIMDRGNFLTSQRAFIRKLSEGKKVMLDLIELATLAYDQREEAQLMMVSLLERGNHDLKLQTHEMVELERKLDSEMHMKEFLGKKGQRRLMLELARKIAARKEAERLERQRLTEKYLGILEDIREFSGEPDIDKIVRLFIEQEQVNFNVFTYTMELNNELEFLQEDVIKMRLSIENERVLEMKRAKQRKENLEKLTNELEATKTAANEAEKAMKCNKNDLDRLLVGVEKMFHLVKGNNAEILNRLGKNQHVSQHNFMRHLQIIEQQTITLMNKASFIEESESLSNLPLLTKLIKQEQENKFLPVPVEKIAPTQPCALCVETVELSQLENDNIRPLDLPSLDDKLQLDKLSPEFTDRLHNLSACRLPRSRKILQRRYL